MPRISVEDIETPTWVKEAWTQVCLFFNWVYENLAPVASYFYHLSKNFILDRVVTIWDTLTSSEFREHVFGMISYFFAYLFNSYHIYQVLIINFFRIIKGTVGVIFSIWNMNNLAQNNRRDERGVGMGNEVISLGSQLFIITATLLTAFVCCMNPLVLAFLATGTSVIYLIKESYFTHKNRARVREEKEKQKKMMSLVSSIGFKNILEKPLSEIIERRREERFRSKRGVVFALFNLIGAGLMLAGCIWIPPLATFSTYIFAGNTFCEVIDRRLFDYKPTRRIGNGMNAIIRFFSCKNAAKPPASPVRIPLSHSVMGQAFAENKEVKRGGGAKESVSDEKTLLQSRKETLANQQYRKRSHSLAFLNHERKEDKPSSSNPIGNFQARSGR